MTWFDGCNTCTMKEIVEPQDNGDTTHPRIRYELDACSIMMCSPIAMREAQCLEWRQCMVDIDEYEQIQDSTYMERVEREGKDLTKDNVKEINFVN